MPYESKNQNSGCDGLVRGPHSLCSCSVTGGYPGLQDQHPQETNQYHPWGIRINGDLCEKIQKIQTENGLLVNDNDRINCDGWTRPVLLNNFSVLLVEKINFADYEWKTIYPDPFWLPLGGLLDGCLVGEGRRFGRLLTLVR